MYQVINQWEQPGYIVTGIHRTGTSMMMLALGQCIPVYWYARENEVKFQPGDGQRCLEPPMADHEAGTFPWHPLYAGMLVKCFCNKIQNLCIEDPVHVANQRTHNVVYMTRDYDAICKSQFRAFGQDLGITSEEYWNLVQEDIKALNKQPNVNLSVFRYESVVANPLFYFNELKEKGWPIEPAKCARVINPQHERSAA